MDHQSQKGLKMEKLIFDILFILFSVSFSFQAFAQSEDVQRHFNAETMRLRESSPVGPLRVGSSVMSTDLRMGIVNRITPEGAYVQVDGLERRYDIRHLAVSNGCNGVFCLNELVMIGHNQNVITAQVAGFHPDGRIAVRGLDQVSHLRFMLDPSEIAFTQACIGTLCTNDQVSITNRGWQGRIEAIYPDKRIVVRVGLNRYIFPVSNLVNVGPSCLLRLLRSVGR